MSNENYNNHDGDYNGWFLAYLTGFILVSLVLMRSVSLDPDNGTHAILSLFYKNLAESVTESATKGVELSFQRIYDFGVSYLVHYPKLQVFYPPLYHLITGLVFYNIFGISAWSAGMSSLTFAVFAMCTLYVLVMKLFGSKTALIAVVLFSVFPYMLMLVWRAMAEHATMFFLFLSLLVYIEARENKIAAKNNKKCSEIGNKKTSNYAAYVILAAVSVLAALSKQAAFFVFPVYFLHLLCEKKWRYAIVFFAASSVLISPYLFAVWKIGGFGINLTIWERYAYEKFVWYFFLEFPFLFVLIGSFAYYLFRARDEKRYYRSYNNRSYHRPFGVRSLFGVWFFVFLAGMLLISFKYRYFTYFLIPTFIITANYLSKIRKRWIILFLFGYFALSAYIVLPMLTYYPIKTVAREIYATAPAYSSVVMLSEGNDFYSSAFMFYLNKFDSENGLNKNLFVHRPCTFFDKDTKSIIEYFENNNVFYVVAVPDEAGYEKLSGISSMLTKVMGGYAEVYKVGGYSQKDMAEYCTRICLTEETICTSYRDPDESFA